MRNWLFRNWLFIFMVCSITLVAGCGGTAPQSDGHSNNGNVVQVDPTQPGDPGDEMDPADPGDEVPEGSWLDPKVLHGLLVMQKQQALEDAHKTYFGAFCSAEGKPLTDEAIKSLDGTWKYYMGSATPGNIALNKENLRGFFLFIRNACGPDNFFTQALKEFGAENRLALINLKWAFDNAGQYHDANSTEVSVEALESFVEKNLPLMKAKLSYLNHQLRSAASLYGIHIEGFGNLPNPQFASQVEADIFNQYLKYDYDESLGKVAPIPKGLEQGLACHALHDPNGNPVCQQFVDRIVALKEKANTKLTEILVEATFGYENGNGETTYLSFVDFRTPNQTFCDGHLGNEDWPSNTYHLGRGVYGAFSTEGLGFYRDFELYLTCNLDGLHF